MNDKHENSDEIIKKLLAIRESWLSKLPEKIHEINTTWDKLTSGLWNENLLQQFHRKVHTIAGSGGTFGLPEVGAAAREAEILIKSIHQEEKEPSPLEKKEIDQKLEQLQTICDQVLKKAAPHTPSGNLTKIRRLRAKDQAEQLIYLVEDDAELGKELKLQLELYQFSVCWFDTLKKFKTAFQQKKPAVVLMDIEMPDGNGTEVLTKIQRLQQDPINTIFISVHDDIHNRLDAIRAGSEVFLSKPLDVAEIVEKLGVYLTNEDSESFRVLIIDDSIDISNHYSALLEEAGMETSIINDPLQTFGCLVDFTPDLILMDLYMPACSGQELAQLIRQRNAYISIPIVFLSSETDKESQIRALNLGGDDFLNKSMAAEHLVEAVKHRAKRSRQISSHLTRDELTGLPNRNALKDRLNQAIRQTQRANAKMGFCVIDLDFFKKINDSLGHMFGDKVLKEVAVRIKNCLRPGDTACRLGGDEFAIIYVEGC